MMILPLINIKPAVNSQAGLTHSFKTKTKPVPLETYLDTVSFSGKSKPSKKPPFEPTDLNFARLLKHITDEMIAGRLKVSRVDIDSPIDESFGIHANQYTLKDGSVVTLGGDFVDPEGGDGVVIEMKEKGAKKAQRFILTETMGELTYLAFEAYTTACGMYSYGSKPDADDLETLELIL
jgi:hypothetical protein